MEILKTRLAIYARKLTEEKQEICARIIRLEQEGRQDEANLQKVRMNIVDVFQTVANADEKAVCASNGGWKQFDQRYRERFQTLSSPWSTRLEKARQHADADTEAIEQTKLDALAWIKQVYDSLEA